jgi:hypothetical protein
MRLPQLRLKTVMISIAFLALFLTVFVQSILLQRAMVREELLRAMAERDRAVAVRNYQRALSAIDRAVEQAGQK